MRLRGFAARLLAHEADELLGVFNLPLQRLCVTSDEAASVSRQQAGRLGRLLHSALTQHSCRGLTHLDILAVLVLEVPSELVYEAVLSKQVVQCVTSTLTLSNRAEKCAGVGGAPC